jgi:hypothetical protein
MKKIFLIGFCFSLIHFSYASTLNCTYSLNADSVKLNWTAFKTTKKVAVTGNLSNGIKVESHKEGKDLKKFLSGIEVKVDFAKSESGNEARDKNLAYYFFGKLKNQNAEGELENIKLNPGDSRSGTANLKLKFNGRKKIVPIAWQLNKDLEITINGSFDLLDFKADDALKALNQACFDLHKGEDGVSKTWSEVGFTLKAILKENCKP